MAITGSEYSPFLNINQYCMLNARLLHHKYLILFAFVLFALATPKAKAQTTFTENAAAYGLHLGQKKDGGHAWSDFDGDGLMDVLVLENNNNGNVKSFLMRQSPAGTFTNVQPSLAPGMLGDYAERQAVWGDLNNDGRPDFMINSSGNGPRVALQIFIQNSNGTFGNGIGGTAPLTVGRDASYTYQVNPINAEGAGFFDFEGDGDLDIFFDSHNYGIELLRNNYIDHTTSTVANPTPAAMFTHITDLNGSPNVQFGLNQYATDGDYGSAADVNDDGWVDIFMRKRDENDFFLNQGGTFTNGADLGQAQNNNKGANGLWDLDNDGDLDAVWTENGLTQIFRNDGPGIWTPLGAATFPGLPQPSNVDSGSSSDDIDALAGGDIDNDGDIDILFVGDNRSYLYINQLNSPTPSPGVIGSGSPMSFALDAQTFNSGRDGEGTTMVDIDDDGDLDIYMNIDNNVNQLFINNLPAANRNNHLIVDVTEDRGADGSTGGFAGRVALGTNVLIRDCEGNIISGLRQVNGVYGHGTQQPEEVHFGLPLGEGETYIIEVRYPNFVHPTDGVTRLIATAIAQPSTIPGTNHYTLTTTDAELIENPNAPIANDDLETVPYGNTVSVQIGLFDNDSEPDGENFYISDIVQPAIGSVVIDDANLGLVTYTYSAGTPFPGTTFDYTITDSTEALCPALGKSDKAMVTVYEPCADPAGLDSDGDGINDICDLDDDNDGILDTDECGATGGGFVQTASNIIYFNNATNAQGDPGTTFADNGTTWPGGSSVLLLRFPEVINSGTDISVFLGADPAVGSSDMQIQRSDAAGNDLGFLAGANGTTSGSIREVKFTLSGSPVEYIRVIAYNHGARVYGASYGGGLVTCEMVDTDGDSIPNYLDLDSDNDGIYDAVEAGHDIAHTNGRLTGNVGSDGIPDNVQSAPNNGVVNYVVQDSDGDFLIDSLEADSDNDGCNDSDEAYGAFGTDSDSNGMYGSGSPAVDANGVVSSATYQVPNDDNANGTYDFREVGLSPTITTQPQDQSVPDGGNATFLVTVSGVSFTYQWQVSTDGGLNFSDISGATNSTFSVTGVSSSENGNFYRVLVTDTSFLCNSTISTSAILTIANDFDGDGIVDTDDRDDDNDGILDEVEANNCSLGDSTINVVIFSEDFGEANGNRVTTPYTNYAFENGSGDLNDGDYTIFEDISATANWAPTVWQSLGDHTTGTDRMAIFNANNTAGLEFYRRDLVQVVENVPLNISFWVMNIDVDQPSNDGRTEPDITVLIQQGGSTVYSFNTNSIPREADGSPDAWKNFTGSFTPNINTTLELVLINNAPGGAGNDLALDDIQITQSFCDSDGDGIPNNLEADSDGDGCFDSDEAYNDINADSDENGMYGSGTPSVNLDGTVIGASYQVPNDGDGNGYYDYIEANSPPAITVQPVDTTACTNGYTSFSVTATDTDTYQWQLFNGSTWDDLTNIGIHGGTSTATLTITNAQLADNGNQYRVLVSHAAYVCGGETSDTVTLTVDQPVANAGANQEICEGESVTLMASTTGGAPGYTYLWSTGETTASITVTPPGNPNMDIDVDYTVTVTDQNGCQDTDTVSVKVESNPTATVSTVDTTCGLDNGEITFTFPDHPNRTGISFSIDNQATYGTGGFLHDNSGSITYSNLAAGTYNLWVRWGNGECPVSLGSYTIGSDPLVTIDNQPLDQTVLEGANAIFQVNEVNADTYQWQVSTDSGTTFGNITDGTEYSGTKTATLTVINAQQSQNGYLYRAILSNSTTSCAPVTSNAALLTVNVRTVITNRRITFRVKRN